MNKLYNTPNSERKYLFVIRLLLAFIPLIIIGSSVSSAMAANPTTVTVTASKTINTLFARIFGFDSMPVTATATAVVSQGLSTINPNQVSSLAVSIDYTPTTGPAKGQVVRYVGTGAPWLNYAILDFSGKGAAGAISNWSGTNSPTLNIASTQVKCSVPKSCPSWVKSLQVGQSIFVPLVQGKLPAGADTKSFTVYGVARFTISTIDSANMVLTGKFSGTLFSASTQGGQLSGKAGNAISVAAITNGNPAPLLYPPYNYQYINNNSPWQCVLTN